MIVNILDFAMTASPVANYPLNVIFTAFIYAVVPIKLISYIIHRASK